MRVIFPSVIPSVAWSGWSTHLEVNRCDLGLEYLSIFFCVSKSQIQVAEYHYEQCSSQGTLSQVLVFTSLDKVRFFPATFTCPCAHSFLLSLSCSFSGEVWGPFLTPRTVSQPPDCLAEGRSLLLAVLLRKEKCCSKKQWALVLWLPVVECARFSSY